MNKKYLNGVWSVPGRGSVSGHGCSRKHNNVSQKYQNTKTHEIFLISSHSKIEKLISFSITDSSK